MKNATILLSLFATALLTSCADVSPTRVIGDTTGAVGGALIGHAISKGNPLVTAAGAGASVLVSETLQGASNASAKKSYTEGYEKGRSDSTKQRFQFLIDKQRLGPQSNDAAQTQRGIKNLTHRPGVNHVAGVIEALQRRKWRTSETEHVGEFKEV